MRIQLLGLTSVSLLAMLYGCNTTSTADAVINDQRAQNVPAIAADKGRSFVGPELHMAAGEDKMICWVPDWSPDQNYYVTRFASYQGKMGHHLVAMQSPDPLPVGKTWDCTDISNMLNLRPLVLPDNSQTKNLEVMPADSAIKMPKGTTIVFQSHYINYGDTELVFQDVGQLFMTTTPPKSEVNYLIVNDSHITVMPGETTSSTIECVVPGDINLVASLGHMHEWGKRIDVEVVPVGGKKGDATNAFLYQQKTWVPEYRDAPPVQLWGATKPLALHKGDTVRLTCTWTNDKTTPLKYPHEMCTSVNYYYPALPEGLLLCDPD